MSAKPGETVGRGEPIEKRPQTDLIQTTDGSGGCDESEYPIYPHFPVAIIGLVLSDVGINTCTYIKDLSRNST